MVIFNLFLKYNLEKKLFCELITTQKFSAFKTLSKHVFTHFLDFSLQNEKNSSQKFDLRLLGHKKNTRFENLKNLNFKTICSTGTIKYHTIFDEK